MSEIQNEEKRKPKKSRVGLEQGHCPVPVIVWARVYWNHNKIERCDVKWGLIGFVSWDLN